MFNTQDQLNQDENYTYDASNPIIGGSPSDLQHIKTLDPDTGQELNVSPLKNKNFQHTGANNSVVAGGGVQQSPRQVQLGFRLTF